MQVPQERIRYLLDVYVSGRATMQEEDELMDWMQDAPDDSEFRSFVLNLWEGYRYKTGVKPVEWDEMFNRIVGQAQDAEGREVAKIRRLLWTRIAAAAVVFIVIVAGAYLLSLPDRIAPVAEKQVGQPIADIAAPSSNKATLTVHGGKVIVLDSAGVGSLTNQGIANATKAGEGELVYASTSGVPVQMQTLRVPRGSQPMYLKLADGSAVWLNAGSEMTFPNVFTGSERRVVVSGELYFEVAHNASVPFLVTKGDMDVEVLGTKFNVNAYDDEDEVRVTLLEGSVKVRKENSAKIIKPGQSAVVASSAGGSSILVEDDVDLAVVMAWRNGVFNFHDTELKTIMRQIERWYDVDVIYEEPVSQHYNGTVYRQVNASKVLEMLEKAGGVKFSIVGRKVIVSK